MTRTKKEQLFSDIELSTEMKTAEESYDVVENLKSLGSIQIKPLFDSNKPNMGLENYGMVLFPDTYHEEQLAATEINGIVKYLTGLDEFSTDVQNLSEEQKKSKIKEIRSIVSYLEKTLNANTINPDDDDFWQKATLCNPTNKEFWGKISLRCGNNPVVLQPTKDPYDLIKLKAIEAGGFSMVGKSYEDAMAQATPPTFYLDKENKSSFIKTTFKKMRNKAIVILDDVYTKDRNKLLYLTKVLDSNSTRYTFSTPIDMLYNTLDDYINGEGDEPNKTKAAEKFINTAKMPVGELKIKALVKDSSFFRYIVTKTDGMLYYSKKNIMMGRNVSDVVSYLSNPLNEDILNELLDAVEPHWNE